MEGAKEERFIIWKEGESGPTANGRRLSGKKGLGNKTKKEDEGEGVRKAGM